MLRSASRDASSMPAPTDWDHDDQRERTGVKRGRRCRMFQRASMHTSANCELQARMLRNAPRGATQKPTPTNSDRADQREGAGVKRGGRC